MTMFSKHSLLWLSLLLLTRRSNGFPWPDNVTQHSGYFLVNTTDLGSINYFYWFFESRKNPSSDPLLLWLTGGPGCSGEIGLLMENGPFVINGTTEPVLNPYGWNSVANILYVDQPGGTGFTYFTNPDQHVTNEEQVGHELWNFMLMFYAKYPKYTHLKLYVFGESYGGHYVPAVGKAILESNSIYARNFQGIAIGNGWTDPYIQYKEYGPFAYSTGMISVSDMNIVRKQYEACKAELDKKEWTKAFFVCQNVTKQILLAARKKLGRSINPYDYKQPCIHPPLCYDFSKIADFLNRDDVRKALGVGDRKWSPCNPAVELHLIADWVHNLDSDVSMLLDKGKQVLVYSGKLDFICNYFGGRAWTNATQWSGQKMFQATNFKSWLVDGAVAGQVKSYKQLTFLQVEDAGHMVPYNVPKQSLEMVSTFIKNKPFA